VGGATPTIVPFILAIMAGFGRVGGAPGPVAGAATVGGIGGVADGGGAGVALWFIMSIVPLNFGAAAFFRLKLHLLQT
jgi:hypothetical protein